MDEDAHEEEKVVVSNLLQVRALPLELAQVVYSVVVQACERVVLGRKVELLYRHLAVMVASVNGRKAPPLACCQIDPQRLLGYFQLF